MASLWVDPSPISATPGCDVNVTGVTCYSDAAYTTAVTFPTNITTKTRYYFQPRSSSNAAINGTVSLKFNNVEVSTQGGSAAPVVFGSGDLFVGTTFADVTGARVDNVSAVMSYDLTSGEGAFPIDLCQVEGTLVAQQLHLSYFTATRTELCTQFLYGVGGTTGTATLLRLGFWTVDSSGNLTALVGNTTHDSNLLAGTGSVSGSTYSAKFKAATANFIKQAGVRYAVGCLYDGSVAPTILGQTISQGQALTNITPPRMRNIASQSSLPNTLTVPGGVLNGSAFRPWIAVAP